MSEKGGPLKSVPTPARRLSTSGTAPPAIARAVPTPIMAFPSPPIRSSTAPTDTNVVITQASSISSLDAATTMTATAMPPFRAKSVGESVLTTPSAPNADVAPQLTALVARPVRTKSSKQCITPVHAHPTKRTRRRAPFLPTESHELRRISTEQYGMGSIKSGLRGDLHALVKIPHNDCRAIVMYAISFLSKHFKRNGQTMHDGDEDEERKEMIDGNGDVSLPPHLMQPSVSNLDSPLFIPMRDALLSDLHHTYPKESFEVLRGCIDHSIFIHLYGWQNYIRHFTRAPWTPIDSHQLSMIKHDDRSQASEARGENQAVATATT